jgi:hypothetical protein
VVPDHANAGGVFTWGCRVSHQEQQHPRDTGPIPKTCDQNTSSTRPRKKISNRARASAFPLNRNHNPNLFYGERSLCENGLLVKMACLSF